MTKNIVAKFILKDMQKLNTNTSCLIHIRMRVVFAHILGLLHLIQQLQFRQLHYFQLPQELGIQEQSTFTEYHKMTTPQVKIVNAETGEEIIRDANADELTQMEIDAASAAARKAEAEAKATAKAALLERLGITQDEANLLLS